MARIAKQHTFVVPGTNKTIMHSTVVVTTAKLDTFTLPPVVKPTDIITRVTSGTAGSVCSRTITISGAVPTAADSITIGSQTYTWRADATTTAGDVEIGGTVDACAQNLADAINATVATLGTTVGSATRANPHVVAVKTGTGVVTVYSKVPGATGIVISEGTDTGDRVAVGSNTSGGGPTHVVISSSATLTAPYTVVVLQNCAVDEVIDVVSYHDTLAGINYSA